MNVRRPVDYGALFTALDNLLEQDLPQMDLYCEVGRQISAWPEKGAAVAAAEYLRTIHLDNRGFSPRNVRRMRNFHRAYENNPKLIDDARKLGWTKNILIFEGCEMVEERGWYLRAARLLGWSKQELIQAIADRAHTYLMLDEKPALCYTDEKTGTTGNKNDKDTVRLPREYLP